MKSERTRFCGGIAGRPPRQRSAAAEPLIRVRVPARARSAAERRLALLIERREVLEREILQIHEKLKGEAAEGT
jgi:hypothetical protein